MNLKKLSLGLKVGSFVLSVAFLTTQTLAQDFAPRTAEQEARLVQRLRAWVQNPRAAMNQKPTKRDARGRVVNQIESAFSQTQIQTGNFIEAKDSYRGDTCSSVSGAVVCVRDLRPGRVEFGYNDNATQLVDLGDQAVINLTEMGRRRLHSAKLAESPWSDTYWPLYMGAASFRYADPSFPEDTSWKKNHDYAVKNSVASILSAEDNASSIDTLSPAEKYDLLVGDTHGTLAQANWAMGESYYNADRKVETWMGLCHGWAPASYMLPRPRKSLEVLAADGQTKIRFYPSDIKALSTLLWAQVQTADQRFVGGRCNVKNPETDNATGRVMNEECFDTNPGTWHIAVTNQVGISKRSLVMDATFDYEVWNQPIYSYHYSYFNPQTMEPVSDLRSARVSVDAFTNDKFKKFRSRETKYVVGIQMDVEYGVETSPTHERTDSPANDGIREVSYEYDLELDVDGNILGGEWYTNLHPDFLWTPTPLAKALSVGDRHLRGEWSVQAAFPSDWTRVAARASAAGQPLAKVVDALIAGSLTSRR